MRNLDSWVVYTPCPLLKIAEHEYRCPVSKLARLHIINITKECSCVWSEANGRICNCVRTLQSSDDEHEDAASILVEEVHPVLGHPPEQRHWLLRPQQQQPAPPARRTPPTAAASRRSPCRRDSPRPRSPTPCTRRGDGRCRITRLCPVAAPWSRCRSRRRRLLHRRRPCFYDKRARTKLARAMTMAPYVGTPNNKSTTNQALKRRDDGRAYI